MSEPAVGVEIEIDPFKLAELKHLVGSDKLYDKALGNALKDAMIIGDAAAKRATPVVTGHARRSTVADTRRGVLEGRYPYLDWLDEGKTLSGRTMKNPKGGYKIRTFTREAVEAALPGLLDRAGREIAVRWSS